MPRPWHAGCTKISGTLPALSAAARPTGPVPASATRPSASIAIPAGSSGHDGGIAATHSLPAHSRSAAGTNGRIRHRTPRLSRPPQPTAHQHMRGLPAGTGTPGTCGRR